MGTQAHLTSKELTNMRTAILWISSLILVADIVAQTSGVSPPSPVSASASPAVTSSTATASPAASPESALEQSIKKKHKKHFNFTIGDQDSDREAKESRSGDNDIPAMVVPLVGVIFLTVFGAPVLIVAVIMYFGFSKNRMMHRTVRMMVEKGQPVPPALLAPPAPAQVQRSDIRRGVILLMVGLGIMLFLGAETQWEEGVWTFGLIPFLIGAGYLLVWKLEGRKPKTDNPPPLP
jgi:Domain of unknown function (DUF6249)